MSRGIATCLNRAIGTAGTRTRWMAALSAAPLSLVFPHRVVSVELQVPRCVGYRIVLFRKSIFFFKPFTKAIIRRTRASA